MALITISKKLLETSCLRERSSMNALLEKLSLLPAVMREGLVGLRHAMRFFALLDRAAAVLGSVQQFRRQLARHRVLATLAGRINRPAHRQRRTSRGTHF